MKNNNIVLTIVEVLVIGGIVLAYIVPLFSAEEENETESGTNAPQYGYTSLIFSRNVS